jgi:hypothetical protein
MLSEQFLIEAVYQVADVKVLPPGFQARHTYLEVRNGTSRKEMKDNLDVARVLTLITPAEQERRMGDREAFGRTTLFAELRYSDEALRRVFLNGGEPRPLSEYEEFGRSALGALLAGDEEGELRRSYADLGQAGTELWDKMKREGPFNFGSLFRLPKTDPRVGAAVSDYAAITDWAKSMRAAGLALQEVARILAESAPGAQDAALTAARERLKERLADVVRETHDQFGDPLGMLMVYLAANQDAVKILLLTGDDIEALEAGSGEGRVAHA